MTTRFKPDDLTEGLTGAIHETGHALYEQSRNLKYDGLPVNEVSLPPLGLTISALCAGDNIGILEHKHPGINGDGGLSRWL